MDSDPQPTSRPTRRRRPLRIVGWTIIVLSAIAIIAALVVQIVLVTDVPRRIVIGQVQKQLGLVVSAKSMSTGWLGHTALRDVTLSLPLAEQSLVDLPELRVSHTSLIPLLLGRDINLESIELIRPVLHVRQDASGDWNVRRAIELATRTAGAQQASRSNSPARLPNLDVIDAKLYISDNAARTTVVEHINATGRRDGTLAYRYDGDLDKRFRVSGEIAPTARWDHTVRFSANDAESLLGQLAPPELKTLSAKGVWRGRLSSDGLQGRLELAALDINQMTAAGNAAVEIGAQGVQIRPDTLSGEVGKSNSLRLVSGLITADATSARVSDLIVEGFDGQAIVAGQWNRKDNTASLTATWRDMVLPPSARHSGRLDVSFSTPWPNHPQIDASLVETLKSPAGTLNALLKISGKGDSFAAMDWIASVKQLNWSARRKYQLADVTAHLRTRGNNVFLDSIESPTADQLAGRGQYDLTSGQWWVWSRANQVKPPSSGSLPPLTFDFNAWGTRSYFKLQDIFFAVGDLSMYGEGFYDSKLPKPVNLTLRFDHFEQYDPQISNVLTGRLVGRLDVDGTVNPMDLSLQGDVQGSGVTVRGRSFGDLAVQIQGTVNGDGANFQSTELTLLGGRWKLAGSVPADAEQPARLQIDVNGLSLADVDDLLGNRIEKVAGTADGSLAFEIASPRLDAVFMRGRFQARDIKAAALSADSATADVSLHDGVLRIDPIRLQLGDAKTVASLDALLSDLTHLNFRADVADWPIMDRAGRLAAKLSLKTKLDVDVSGVSASGPIKLGATVMHSGKPAGELHAEADIDRRTIQVKQFTADVFGGSARGSALIDIDHVESSTATLEWKSLDLTTFSSWHERLEGLAGSSSGSISVAPSTGPHPLGSARLDIDLRFHDARYRGLSLGDSSTAGIYLARDRIVTDGVTLNFAGGTARLFARGTRHEGSADSILVNVDFEKLDLDQLVHAVDPGAESMRGLARGQFTLVGDPHNIKSVFGEGDAYLDQSDLINFDPVGQLFAIMKVGVDRSAANPSGVASVHARLEGSTLNLTSARIFDRGIEVRAIGSVGEIWKFPDSPLRGSAVGSARPLKDLKLPFLADVDQILSVLQSNLTSINLGGTVHKPEVVQTTFAEIGQGLRKLLVGDVTSETQNSAQR